MQAGKLGQVVVAISAELGATLDELVAILSTEDWLFHASKSKTAESFFIVLFATEEVWLDTNGLSQIFTLLRWRDGA